MWWENCGLLITKKVAVSHHSWRAVPLLDRGRVFSTTPQDDVTFLLPSISIVVAHFMSYGARYWGSYELQCGEAFTGCNAHCCRPVLKYKYIYGTSRSWRGSSGLLMVVSGCLQSHKNMASHGFSIYQALGGHMATLINVTLLSKTMLWGGKQGVTSKKEEAAVVIVFMSHLSLCLCLGLIWRSPIF